MTDGCTLLRSLFDEALRAVSPEACVGRHLPRPPRGRTIVLGAGKAAAAMARAVERRWQGQLSGLVVTRYGHAVPCEQVQVIEAAHPVPDAAGLEAARRMLELARALGPDDLALCLLSGGGSALLTLPADCVGLADKQAVTAALLTCGAAISEINCVRKHLSAIKGGRLAAACEPARVHTIVISDVPGDDPATVASGPTLPDSTTADQALAVLRRYDVAVPPGVGAHLARGGETIKPDDRRLESGTSAIAAAAGHALAAAASAARKAGIDAHVLGDCIEGEARTVAVDHARVARSIVERGRPVAPPCVLLSGGETTVTVRGPGRGGRNTEYLLALALALDGNDRVHGLACDTDGIDGTGDNAGGLIRPDSLARARVAGLDPRALLRENDAYRFFETLDDLVVTGPTRTNVNDFRAIYIDG